MRRCLRGGLAAAVLVSVAGRAPAQAPETPPPPEGDAQNKRQRLRSTLPP